MRKVPVDVCGVEMEERLELFGNTCSIHTYIHTTNNIPTFRIQLMINHIYQPPKMHLTALLTTLRASTAFAKHILQLDGSVKIVPDTQLDARQFIPDCCSNNFAPPCGCGSAYENACDVYFVVKWMK